MLRVGVLASYTVSAEDLFQEQVERWVDVASRREVPAHVVDRLARSPGSEKDQWPSAPVDQLTPAVVEAHRLIEADTARRGKALSKQLSGAHEKERTRVVAYYADVIAGLERRLEAAAPDRRALLDDRLAGTREEQARRLAEISEKHQARHDIRPYRLHLVGVPAVRLPVDVRRGDRRYPMELDWLAPAGTLAGHRCPWCDGIAPLVAGKSRLGCLACLTPATSVGPPQVPAPRPAPRPAARPVPRPAEEPARAAPPARPAPGRRSGTAVRKPVDAPPQVGVEERQRVPPKQAETLAATVWNAVAARRGSKLRQAVAPGSPAAVLSQLYGVNGPRYAIGLPPTEELRGFTVGSAWLAGSSGYTAGAVQTDLTRHPYALHWQADGRAMSVVEVLAFPPCADGRLSGFYWMFGGWRRLTGAPVDLPGLDEVARLLVSVGVPRQGLSVTARALVAWWRLGDLEPPEHPPAVVAAGVHRLVASRAGGNGRFREAAAAYHVNEAALRRVDAILRRRLALGPTRAW
jgi:hypothetical protein